MSGRFVIHGVRIPGYVRDPVYGVDAAWPPQYSKVRKGCSSQ